MQRPSPADDNSSRRPPGAFAHDLVVMVLAGGEGQRLHPLTRRRAKPAVRFAGQYRMIDFSLSNAVNCGYGRIYVLTQFGGTFLSSHIRRAWTPMLSDELGQFVQITPAQKIHGRRWYQGTADAIYQNLFILQSEKPQLVLILSGDHAYKMDYRPMVQQHRETDARLTIASLKLPQQQCTGFGVLQIDDNGRIISFTEKPSDPAPLPDDPDHSLVSMGIYLWNTGALAQRVANDATRDTSHDFGRDIIPAMIEDDLPVYAHEFSESPGCRSHYWQDIGTLDAYWHANMDLLGPAPALDLYDKTWPVYTYRELEPGVKIVGDNSSIDDSVIGPGSVISNAEINQSMISPNVTVADEARVTESILLDGAHVGPHATVHRAIIDEDCKIPQGYKIGVDRSIDEQNFVVSLDGIPVVPQNFVFGE